MVTQLTRWIQARNGHRVVPLTCRACGRTNPRLDQFPQRNLLGLSGLLWATRRPIPFGRSLRCPACGEALTVDEYLDREPPSGPPA